MQKKGQWLWVQKLEVFVKALDFRFYFLPDPAVRYILIKTCLHSAGTSRLTHVPASATLFEALQCILTFADTNPEDVTFDQALGPIMREELAATSLDGNKIIRCFWKNQLIATLALESKFDGMHLVEDIISPTQPFEFQEPADSIVISCVDQVYASLTAHPTFMHAITFMEFCAKACRELRNPSHCAIAWEQPPLLFAIQTPQEQSVAFIQMQLNQVCDKHYQVFVSPVSLPTIAEGDLVFVRPQKEVDDVLVILETPRPTACCHVKSVPRTLPIQTTVITRHGQFELAQHNRRPLSSSSVQCHNGDVLDSFNGNGLPLMNCMML